MKNWLNHKRKNDSGGACAGVGVGNICILAAWITT